MTLKPAHEAMTVHAFVKGMLPGSFSESLLRIYPKTFESQRNVPSSVRPRAAGRPRPMRVHEATTEKKGVGKQQPYEKPQTGVRTRRDPPPKHNFCVELKELIVIPNIATRLRIPQRYTPKSTKEIANIRYLVVNAPSA